MAPVPGVCHGCGETIAVAFEAGAPRQVKPCACTTRKGKPSEVLARHLDERTAARPGKVVAGPWSAAKPGACERGHRHDSRLEVRLCGLVHAQALPDQRVFVHARVPLWALGTDAGGRPASYFTPDFVVTGPGADGCPEIQACFDAKGRRSREWRRGRAAFKASYGVEVAEVAEVSKEDR